MSYTSPKVEITQNFEQNPTSTTPLLAALIVGPQYDLHRYSVAGEKPSTTVVNPTTPDLGNAYQSGSNVTYLYPNLPAGNVVDQSFVAVDMDNVYAEYFPNASLGSTDENAAAVLGTTPNSLRFTNGSNTIVKSGNGFSLSSYFSNRPVAIGDIATITDNLNNVLVTPVTGFVADTNVTDPDSGLGSTIGAKATTGTTGVTTGSNNVFTDSSGGEFTDEMIGQVLTILTIGSYTILSVASNGLSVTLSGTPAAGSGLSYYVGGVYNDTNNILPNAGSNGSITYHWAGSGSDPGVTGITVGNSTSFAYVGYNNQRILSDTYKIVCTTSGGASTAVFTVSSNNNVFSPFSTTMTSGGIVAIDTNGNNNVRLTFTFSSASITVGQSWTIPVVAASTMAEPTTSGTYTGAGSIVYKLTVTKGGPLYTGSNGTTAAIVSITSSNVDASPSVQPIASTAFQVGTLGVMAAFSAGSNNGGLIYGDVYYIVATPAILGAIKTLQFADNLSVASIANASSWTISLASVQNSVSIDPVKNSSDNTFNWVASSSGVTINSGINTVDSNLLTSLGALAALPIISGNIFVTYRDLVTTNSNSIGSTANTSGILPVLGTIDPANPIAQGVYDALLNSAGAIVYWLTVPTDDLAGYTNALGIAAGSTSVYGLVPLSTNVSIQEAFAAHVDAQSAPAIGRWRKTWITIPAVPTTLLYNEKPDSSNWLATVARDPLSSSTIYSLFNVAGATFITDGVRAGDTVLFNFVSAPDGSVSYSSFTVASIRSQTSLTTTIGLPAAVNIASKFQLQRNYSSSEQASNLGAEIAAYNDRRVNVVFPDTVQSSGVVMSGVFLAAALSGLASGVPANQGLTNATVLGFDTLTEALVTFQSADLDTLASNGAFIVTQSVLGSTPYVRQQLTSAEAGGNLNSSEDSITRNVDSVSYQLSNILKPFIGVYNINQTTLLLIKSTITGLLNSLQANSTSITAGPQLLSGTNIVSIAQDPTFQDRVLIVIQLVVPYPFNYILVNLTVGQTGVVVSVA